MEWIERICFYLGGNWMVWALSLSLYIIFLILSFHMHFPLTSNILCHLCLGQFFINKLLLLWKTMHGFYLRYSSHYAKFLSTEAKNISFGLVNIWLCRSKNHQSPAAVCHVLNLEQALAYQICKYLYPHWLSKLLGSAEMIGLF